MSAPRAVAFLLAGAAGLAALPAPAAAQIADDVVLNILRECARIDDPSARLACYDNNMRNAGGPARSTIPGQVQVQGGGAVLAPQGTGPQGFGREDVRTPERFNAAPAGELAEITVPVTAVEQRGPGIYAVTLEGGAQWLFTESVPRNYSVPRVGSRVEIRRGSMDSFLLRFNNQASVRVRRIQ